MAGRILVLDDEENYVAMLQDLLIQNNYCVDMATNPERAIERFEEMPYDLIISDYKMPVMDGADFLKRARSLYPDLPFILVSGLMNTPELVKVANMSVTLVFEKPLDTEAFLESVSRFCEPLSAAERERMVEQNLGFGEMIDDPTHAADETNRGLPDAPSFFAAKESASRSFLEALWSHAKVHKRVYIAQPEGADSQQALSDLSKWLGYGDLPLRRMRPSELLAADAVDNLLSQGPDWSRLISVECCEDESAVEDWPALSARLNELEAARLHVAVLFHENGVPNGIEPVHLLPPLSARPQDLATYAVRLARVYAARCGKRECATFTEQAVDQLLSHNWPGNYAELASVLEQCITAAVDGALEAADLAASMHTALVPDRPGEARLAAYLSRRQATIVQRYLDQGAAAEVAEAFGLTDAPAPDAIDPAELPLIRAHLADPANA